MASGLKMISLATALAAVALLFAAPQAQAWDAVPVWPPEHVLVAIPGGGGGGAATSAAVPRCLSCTCCSKSDPRNCQITSCCSIFNCDTAGKCNLVQLKCGCSGCLPP